MRKILKQIAKAITKMVKVFGKGTSAIFGALFGRGSGEIAALEAVPDTQAETIAEFDSDPENTNDLSPYERRRRGFEPIDVHGYAAAPTPEAKAEHASRMTMKTRHWVESLSDEDLKTVRLSSRNDLTAHLTGSRHIPGLSPVGIMSKARDPMPNPHGNDLATRLLGANQNRPSVKAMLFREARRQAGGEGSTFGRREHGFNAPAVQSARTEIAFNGTRQSRVAFGKGVFRKSANSNSPRPPVGMFQ